MISDVALCGQCMHGDLQVIHGGTLHWSQFKRKLDSGEQLFTRECEYLSVLLLSNYSIGPQPIRDLSNRLGCMVLPRRAETNQTLEYW